MRRTETQVYQFRISLKGISPKIWRRIQVPQTYTFWDLSVSIQDAMEWGGHHLHEFSVPNPKTGLVDVIGIPDEDDDRHVRTGWKTKIARYFSIENTKAEYLYDFGDYWEHTILLEKILPGEPGKEYPICIAGKRKAPPDDVGSIPGYEKFVVIMKDPGHKEHAEMVAWYGEVYDPEYFDCADIVFSDPDVMFRLMMEG